MPKSTRPLDPNQLAKLIVDIATGEIEDHASEAKRHPNANPHRPAGRLGGKVRAAKLTPERRAEIAKKAAEARWNMSQD